MEEEEFVADSESVGSTGSRGLPKFVTKQLASDMEKEFGGIKCFRDDQDYFLLARLCNFRDEVYGAPKSDLRRKVQNKIAYWKSLDEAQYTKRVLLKYGVPPSAGPNKKSSVKSSVKSSKAIVKGKKKNPPKREVAIEEKDLVSDLEELSLDDGSQEDTSTAATTTTTKAVKASTTTKAVKESTKSTDKKEATSSITMALNSSKDICTGCSMWI